MQNGKNIGFEHVVRLWLDSIALEFKRTTCDRYECITDELCKRFCSKEIGQINNDCLNGFLREREADGWSYATLTLAISIIRKIMSFSVEHGFIREFNLNPLKLRKSIEELIL